jgi:hypothetical protein
MKTYLIVSLILISSAECYAQSKDEMEIRKILGNQVIAWNMGELENFMQGYWQSDSLKFIGKSGLTYGWDETLKSYEKNYPDTAAMGKLSFDLLEVKQLSALYFFVIGKWQLNRSIGNVSGHFTLLFKKINKEWRIVVDHSS